MKLLYRLGLFIAFALAGHQALAATEVPARPGVDICLHLINSGSVSALVFFDGSLQQLFIPDFVLETKNMYRSGLGQILTWDKSKPDVRLQISPDVLLSAVMDHASLTAPESVRRSEYISAQMNQTFRCVRGFAAE